MSKLKKPVSPNTLADIRAAGGSIISNEDLATLQQMVQKVVADNTAANQATAAVSTAQGDVDSANVELDSATQAQTAALATLATDIQQLQTFVAGLGSAPS